MRMSVIGDGLRVRETGARGWYRKPAAGHDLSPILANLKIPFRQ